MGFFARTKKTTTTKKRNFFNRTLWYRSPIKRPFFLKQTRFFVKWYEVPYFCESENNSIKLKAMNIVFLITSDTVSLRFRFYFILLFSSQISTLLSADFNFAMTCRWLRFSLPISCILRDNQRWGPSMPLFLMRPNGQLHQSKTHHCLEIWLSESPSKKNLITYPSMVWCTFVVYIHRQFYTYTITMTS